MFRALRLKLHTEHPRALVLVPLWNQPEIQALIAATPYLLVLPQGPTFCRAGVHLMPAPRWRTGVLFFRVAAPTFDFPSFVVGILNPTRDHQLPPTFVDFTGVVSDFMTAADSTQLARALTSFRIRTRSLSDGWWTTVLEGKGLSLDRADAKNLCAAYDLFADRLLVWSYSGVFGWNSPPPPPTTQSEELAALRLEPERLKLAQTSATEASLS